MQQLCAALGNPQKKLTCIHIAGTNGKGSCAAMLQSILMETGMRVGMYTSPHLKTFNERIRINNKLISNKDLVKLYVRVKPYITTQSFFDITTALAYLYFAEKKVNIAIIEVGLGGRLDSTNVITPLISIITNISLEHVNTLGITMSKIAAEKAGIIKKKYPSDYGYYRRCTIHHKSNCKKKSCPYCNNKKTNNQ